MNAKGEVTGAHRPECDALGKLAKAEGKLGWVCLCPVAETERECDHVFACPHCGEMANDRIAALRALLEESYRSHEGHGDYCQVANTKHCDCGADEWNARVDAALKTP